MIEPHVAVDVQRAGPLPGRLEPVARQPAGPLFGGVVLAQPRQLLAEATHFRHAVQPQQLAQFPRRLVLQLLDRLDPTQRHESQHRDDLRRGVIAAQRGKTLVQMVKQTVLCQRRQGAQDAAEGDVAANLKLGRGAVEQSQGGGHPLQRPRAGDPHRGRRILEAALRLVRSGPRGDWRAGLHRGPGLRFGGRVSVARRSLDTSLIDGLTEGVAFDFQLVGHLGGRAASVQEFLSPGHHLRGEHVGASATAGAKEGFNAFVPIFLDAAFDAVLRDPKRLDDFARSTASLAHQLGAEHSERSPILLAMLKHRMDPTEVGPLSVLLNHTDPIIDLCGSIGDKWEQCLGHSTFLLKVLLFPRRKVPFYFPQSQGPLISLKRT